MTTRSNTEIVDADYAKMTTFLSPTAVAEIRALSKPNKNRLAVMLHTLQMFEMDEDVYKARQVALNDAFKRVQPATHWKDKINALVQIKDGVEQQLIYDAVIHFTGTTPRFESTKSGMTRVRAIGYWAGPCGS